MSQFQSIADGPLDGYAHDAGFNVSLEKVGEQVTVDPISDITNQGEVFVLSQTGPSSSLFVLKTDSSVLQSELLHNIEVFDHLKENKWEDKHALIDKLLTLLLTVLNSSKEILPSKSLSAFIIVRSTSC